MVIDLFSDFDFKVLEQPGFKEDAVREELITPILHKLGYRAFGSNKIIRSKRLEHPFVSVGSTQRKISITPDYMLLIDNRPVLVLDAKSPIEEISSGPAREQAYFYAIHPEIRTRLYALCNGREFIVFHVEKDAPILYFHVSTITRHWDKLYNLLSPDAFNPQSEFKPKLPSPVKQKNISTTSTMPSPNFEVDTFWNLFQRKRLILFSIVIAGLLSNAILSNSSNVYTGYNSTFLNTQFGNFSIYLTILILLEGGISLLFTGPLMLFSNGLYREYSSCSIELLKLGSYLIVGIITISVLSYFLSPTIVGIIAMSATMWFARKWIR